MKFIKSGLRLWITLTSLFSFFVGWVMLAHAPKPNQANSPGQSQTIPTPLPTLAPLQPLFQDDGGSGQNNNFQLQSQPFFSNQPVFRPRPFFSTGGS
jgi:hypothetical protein